MIKYIKKHKIATLCTLLLILFILLLPFIINFLYNCNAPIPFFYVTYSVGDLLSYYGTILSFVGTIILGSITIIQTFNAQKKTDEVNRLNLELTKRSMAMAEQNYHASTPPMGKMPKFELFNLGYSGVYANLTVKLKNVSSFIVSNLKSVSFEVLDNKSQYMLSSKNVTFQNKSLISGQEVSVEFHNSELCTTLNPESRFNVIREYWTDIQIIWKFCCEDEQYNVHYFKATLNIASTDKFACDMWEINQIG